MIPDLPIRDRDDGIARAMVSFVLFLLTVSMSVGITYICDCDDFTTYKPFVEKIMILFWSILSILTGGIFLHYVIAIWKIMNDIVENELIIDDMDSPEVMPWFEPEV